MGEGGRDGEGRTGERKMGEGERREREREGERREREREGERREREQEGERREREVMYWTGVKCDEMKYETCSYSGNDWGRETSVGIASRTCG